MSKTSFWVIAESDIDLWHTDAEEIEASTPEWAAELFAKTFGDEHDDEEELAYIVADNRRGVGAKRYVVCCEVVREYRCTNDGESYEIDDGPNEHFDDESDEQEIEEKPKGCEDDQTLNLFDTSC